MTDYERHMPRNQDHPRDHDWGASVRTIMQGLILLGVAWLASNVSNQSAQIAGMQVQLADLKFSFEGMPALKDRVTTLEARQAELIRLLEKQDQNNTAMKRWTR